ncbi:MAG TPA: RNA 2',3'-cyclic phosphodiesterase [Pontiella sp.]
MNTVRAFIAIDIGDEIRARLDALQRRLKKVHADVRWVHPGNIHLTLAFIGDVPTDKTDMLKPLLDTGLSGVQPFSLKAYGTGYFGRPGRPRVIWAGIPDAPKLMDLQAKTIRALLNAGIEFDNKPFHPHLTLGRVKALNHTESLLAKIEKYKDAELGQTAVNAVNLIKSRLTPQGAEYTILHQVRLSSVN